MVYRCAAVVLVRPSRLRRTVSATVTGAVVAAVLASDVLPSTCIIHFVTGWDCPFCGGSRALAALMEGDISSALGFNAFAVLAFIPLVTAMLGLLGLWETGIVHRLWPSGKSGTVCAALLAASVLAWSVTRNLPFAPFTALRV